MNEDYKELGRAIAAALDRNIRSSDKLWTLVAKELFSYLKANSQEASSFPYDIEDEDAYVFVKTDNSGGTAPVNLPEEPAQDRFIAVKDVGGFANTQSININSGATPIDGSVIDVVIDEDYGSVLFVYDGSEWRVLGTGGGVSGGGGGGGTPGFEEFSVSGPGDDTYTLSSIPDASTVRVLLNGLQLQTGEYTVSGNDVTVSHTIASGDEVAILYYV